MNAFVRPQTRLAAALVAAGVVSAASVVSMPAYRGLPTITADVAYTSAVTDTLRDFGQGVEVLNALVGIHVDATISLPFEATLAIMAAAQHPELSDNVLSFLVQRFVNPSVGDPIHAYPFDTELAVARLADLLPYPLGPSATAPGLILDGGVAFAAVFNSVLGQLADPIPGYEAVRDVMNNSVLGGAVVAAHLATRAPMNMAWNGANYLGYLPASIEATFESALAKPDQIPGLVSNLVYGLLSPDAEVGLFGKLLHNAVDPFTWLPAPIGYTSGAMSGLANQARDLIAGVMTGILSTLPAPVAPSALPAGADAELGPRGGVSAAKSDDETVTLKSVKADEKQSDTTASKVQSTLASAKSALSTENVADPDAGAGIRPDKHDADKVDADKVDADKVEPEKVAPPKIDAPKADAVKADPVKAAPSASDSDGAKASDGAKGSDGANAA